MQLQLAVSLPQESKYPQITVSVEKVAFFEHTFTFARAKLVGGCGFKTRIFILRLLQIFPENSPSKISRYTVLVSWTSCHGQC